MPVRPALIRSLNRRFPSLSQGIREEFELKGKENGKPYCIRVDRPLGEGPFQVLFYLDATLPSSRLVNPFVDAQMPGKVLLVGVGYEQRIFRRRNQDMVPPSRLVDGQFGSRSRAFGHADTFYGFLTQELWPLIQQRYSTTLDVSLVGHSLGGLFALYAHLQGDSPFQRYLAISPSVWVNRRSLLRIQAHGYARQAMPDARLYMAAGSLERFNLVLGGMEAYHSRLREQTPGNLLIKADVFPWKNHFSVIRPALKAGLAFLYPQ